MKWLNANQSIYFKLKQKGIEVLDNRGIRLEPDNRNLYNLPLWEFMNVFGEYMVYRGNEVNPYFDMDICFNEEDMWGDSDIKEYQDACNELRNKLDRII